MARGFMALPPAVPAEASMEMRLPSGMYKIMGVVFSHPVIGREEFTVRHLPRQQEARTMVENFCLPVLPGLGFRVMPPPPPHLKSTMVVNFLLLDVMAEGFMVKLRLREVVMSTMVVSLSPQAEEV